VNDRLSKIAQAHRDERSASLQSLLAAKNSNTSRFPCRSPSPPWRSYPRIRFLWPTGMTRRRLSSWPKWINGDQVDVTAAVDFCRRPAEGFGLRTEGGSKPLLPANCHRCSSRFAPKKTLVESQYERRLRSGLSFESESGAVRALVETPGHATGQGRAKRVQALAAATTDSMTCYRSPMIWQGDASTPPHRPIR
jgi:hypothetical protein